MKKLELQSWQFKNFEWDALLETLEVDPIADPEIEDGQLFPQKLILTVEKVKGEQYAEY